MKEKKSEVLKLKAEINKIDAERDIVVKEWVKDIKAISEDSKFDVYSRKGKRRIEKATEKYAPIFFELDEHRAELVDKHNGLIDDINREKYNKKN